MSDRIARAALTRLSEPGDLRLRAVVAELGAARVYHLLCDEQDVRGVYTDVAERLRGLDPERTCPRPPNVGSGSSVRGIRSGPATSRTSTRPGRSTTGAVSRWDSGSRDRSTSPRWLLTP